MSVFDRIGKVVRAEWSHRFRRRPGEASPDDDVAPSRGRPSPAAQPRRAVADADAALRVLELSGAPSLAEVRAQYQKLAQRYYPKTTSASADDAHAARVVLDALTDALELLEEHLLPLSSIALALALAFGAASSASTQEPSASTQEPSASTQEPSASTQEPSASDDGPKLEAQIETWVGLDSNATRLPDGQIDQGQPGHITPPPPTVEHAVADGLAQTDGSVAVEVARPGLLLRSESLFGLKLFFTQSSEWTMVGQERATLSSTDLPGNAVLTLSLLGKGRAQLSGARDYGLLDAAALVDKPVLDWLWLRAGLHGEGFHAFDVPLFSSAAAGVLLGARAVTGPESVELLVDAGGRGFPFSSQNLLTPGARNADPQLRADAVTVASLTATSARRLYLSAGYSLTRNASNARGESFTRHRLSLLVGARLPGDVDCIGHGAVQLTQYDDGVSIGQIDFLGADLDDESHNVLEVTLSRALLFGVSVVGSVGFYGNEFAAQGARFSRETAAIGIRAEL